MTEIAIPLLFLALASGNGQYDGPYRGEDIQLICYGEAEKTTTQTHSGFEWDAQQHKYVPKSSVETGKSDFEAAINVSIHGDEGSLRLPKSLVPPINGGSDNGWWTIDDLIVGHNEIRGKFRLNALNKPNVTINRLTGVMTIDGMIKFTGRCDADDGHRRF
ncbi:hypothetical protein [Asticcacaulis sp.]|uniref:hypothetical protein n=1 Tax=Asticcacaulis sp. TaxID=1872648 RepID=UPI0031D6611F